MSRRLTMITIIIAIILIVIAVTLWWHLFFGLPNPPLSRTSVTVASSSLPSALPSSAAAAAPSASSSDSPDAANPPLAEEPLSVDGATFSVEVASTSLEQARGLSYRTSLGANDGMLFVFSRPGTQTFWMKDMRFPLDMIWISGNTVAGYTQDVPAPASGTQLWQLSVYASPANVDKVLEVNAGTVAQYGIKTGDAVVIGAH